MRRMNQDSEYPFSLLTEFDDLMRNEKILTDGQAEREFLKFVKNSELNRRRWEQSQLECQRLDLELAKATHEILGLETKLQQARTMVDNEATARKRAEAERDRLASQLERLKQLIFDTDAVDEGTLRKLKNFDTFNATEGASNEGGGYGNILSPGLMSEAANCRRRRSINMTDGSVLDVDDLSFDETLDLCASRTRAGTSFRKTSVEGRESRKRSRSNPRRSVFLTPEPLEDRARKKERRSRSVGISDKVDILEITPRPSTNDTPQESRKQAVESLRNISSSNFSSREAHDFEVKTELKANKCSTCGKRIKLGKLYQKCKLCKLSIHSECQPTAACVAMCPHSPVKVSSIPSGGHASRTPSKRDTSQRAKFESPMLQ